MSIQKQFKKAIKCGLGKAYILMQQHPEEDFSTHIKKALLKRNCNDGQCEGSRDLYYYNIISIAPQKDELVKFILKKLEKGYDDWYVLRHLYQLASHFYFDGYQEAKSSIFIQFKKETHKESSEWHGIKAILKIEGLRGFEKLMRIRGKWLKYHNDKTDWDDIITAFNKLFPFVNSAQHIKLLAKKDNNIQYYLDAIDRYNESKKSRSSSSEESQPKPPPYTQIREIIQGIEQPLYGVRYLAKKLTSKEYKELALAFEKEEDIIKKERYCNVFTEKKYPLNPMPLFFFMKQQIARKGDEYEISRFAKALSYFQSKTIRKFAIQHLNQKKYITEMLYLLVNNYKRQDAKLIRKLIKNEKSYYNKHDFILPLIRIYSKKKNKKAKKALETLYEHTNCGMCRIDIIKLLKKRKLLSSDLLKETQFDSHKDSRRFYAKNKKRS